MPATASDYRSYLNDIYYGEDLRDDPQWAHLADNGETEDEVQAIDGYLAAGLLGSALKLADPVQFNVGLSEWQAEQEKDEQGSYWEPEEEPETPPVPSPEQFERKRFIGGVVMEKKKVNEAVDALLSGKKLTEMDGFGDEELTPEEREDLNISGMEGEASEEEGAMAPEEALDAIAELMSGVEWDSDTLEGIADLVRKTGRDIADVEEAPAGEGEEEFEGEFECGTAPEED